MSMGFTKWLKGFFSHEGEVDPYAINIEEQVKALEEERKKKLARIAKERENLLLPDVVATLKKHELLGASYEVKDDALVIKTPKTETVITDKNYRGAIIKSELYTDTRGNKFPSKIVHIFFSIEGHRPSSPDDIPCVSFNMCER